MDYYEFLKLKKSDLTTNNKEKEEYDSKPNITSYNKSKNDKQNKKIFSQNKLNITTNENIKINISGIPICPKKSKNSFNNKNNDAICNNKYINNENDKNIIYKNIKTNNNNNFLVTPRCIKKKRQLNNYAEYYKLKILKSKDISNI